MVQQRYREFMVRGRPGMPADSTPRLDVTRVNDDPRTAQVATFTVTGDAIVTVEIDGVSISTLAAGGSIPLTADALAAAINAEPLVSGVVVAVSATNDVVVTARLGGLGFAATESDANLTLVQTTANADAAPVGFGVLVVEDGSDAASPAPASSVGLKAANLFAALVDVTQMTAKVMTAAHTFVATTTYTTSVTVGGVTYVATSISPASLQALVEDLTPQLNAQLPANTVAVIEDNVTMTFTAELAGLDFQVSAGASDATAIVVVATTTGGPGTDINRAVAGITMEDLAQELTEKNSLTDTQTMQYLANDAMRVRRMGHVYVATEESIDPSTMGVYVGVDGGSQGLWRGTAAADFLPLDSAKFRWDENAGSDLAVLAVDLTA